MSERCAPKKNVCQFHGTKTVTVWRICSYTRRASASHYHPTVVVKTLRAMTTSRRHNGISAIRKRRRAESSYEAGGENFRSIEGNARRAKIMTPWGGWGEERKFEQGKTYVSGNPNAASWENEIGADGARRKIYDDAYALVQIFAFI